MSPPPLAGNLTARAFRAMLSGIRALGHEPASWLAAADIAAPVLEDPDARIPVATVIEFMTLAVGATGDEHLGLHAAEHAELGAYDAPFYAMHASATLGAAYERLARYQRLFHDSSRAELRIEDGHAALRHRPAAGMLPKRQGAEFLLASWVRSGRAVTGVDWAPDEVRFAHPAPDDASEHRRFFCAPVRFGCGENAVWLAPELLALPCTRADAALAALLDRYAAERIDGTPAPGRLADRVRAMIEAGLPAGDVSATALAKRLGMSVRSLNRLLAAEGTSYQGVLDGLRHELAARGLSNPRVSVWQVAFDLGFSDLSAFYRAFRRWTGTTPAGFRTGAERGARPRLRAVPGRRRAS